MVKWLTEWSGSTIFFLIWFRKTATCWQAPHFAPIRPLSPWIFCRHTRTHMIAENMIFSFWPILLNPTSSNTSKQPEQTHKSDLQFLWFISFFSISEYGQNITKDITTLKSKTHTHTTLTHHRINTFTHTFQIAAHARAHTHTHARTRARTHTETQAHAHTHMSTYICSAFKFSSGFILSRKMICICVSIYISEMH